MAYNAKLIQSRPNTVVEFWSPSAETIAKLDQFKSEGKIISYTKVAKGFLTKPIVKDGKIFIIDTKMRILQFN